MKRLALLGFLCAAGALAGCGGGEATGGVTISPTSEVVAESDTKEPDAPPITKGLVREWPTSWCDDIRIGESREEVVAAMGAYPTEQDSHKIPLIPPIGTDRPPEAAGSDTWEAPGSYQFNAFYDTNLRVQQLDFGGPAGDLPCAAIRVG